MIHSRDILAAVETTAIIEFGIRKSNYPDGLGVDPTRPVGAH
jgi:hypothetical protein